jgi:F-type H+-transporting ATPase subunit a
MAAGQHSPLDHVLDHPTIELPWVPGLGSREVHLPNIFGFQITRFMVMEVIAAILIVAIIVPLVRHVASRRVTQGRFFNMFEAILLFIRDRIARPAIDGEPSSHGAVGHDDIVTGHPETSRHGHGAESQHGHEHGAAHGRLSDQFLPFLWTLFFFILFCNLLGMIPGGASATGSISVTATLALIALGAVLICGMSQQGVLGFWKGIVPTMDVPPILKPFLWGLMFVIEVAGLLIRHVVLSVRLFANMLAGHIVLAVILGFVAMASGWITYLVTPASILGVVTLSLLELFVAFLQAYIFTFLAALFIGSAAHAH